MKLIISAFILIAGLSAMAQEKKVLKWHKQHIYEWEVGKLLQMVGEDSTPFKNSIHYYWHAGAICVHPRNSRLPTMAEFNQYHKVNPNALWGSFWTSDVERENPKQRQMVFKNGSFYSAHKKKISIRSFASQKKTLRNKNENILRFGVF